MLLDEFHRKSSQKIKLTEAEAETGPALFILIDL